MFGSISSRLADPRKLFLPLTERIVISGENFDWLLYELGYKCNLLRLFTDSDFFFE